MKLHDLIQGSPQWLAHRAKHFNASDAPAMMGCSPYKTRTQLLHERHTGLSVEVDAATQRRFDDGHRYEALARLLAEQIIDDTLYPGTGSEGLLSASFDGLTLECTIAFEHKSINDELRAVMTPACTGADLPLYYRVQMEHQATVSQCRRVLFMASKWTDDGNLIEERHCWYEPDPKLRAAILAGWEQFAKDLRDYVPVAAAAPAPVGKAPETLPALRIEVTGMVTASNLAEFKETALSAIRSVNRDLSTDADFADAEKAVKWCSDVESRLAAAKDHALSQTASIDALFKAIDDISAEARRVRLELDKLVTRRKAEVKETIVAKAKAAYETHVKVLIAETGGPWIVLGSPDFAGAVKGKRTVASVQDAVDTVLANAKIEADASARRIRAALACLKDDGAGYEFLFSDRLALIGKPLDDLRVLVRARITEHKAKEAQRIEAETARIRAEEQARAQREAAAAAEAEKDRQRQEAAARAADEAVKQAAVAAQPAPTVILRGPVRAPAANELATLKLGVICERLGFAVTAAFLDTLGIKPAATDKAAKLYRESDWSRICIVLASHISAVHELYTKEAA